MAIATLSPSSCDTPAIEDPVTLREARLLFAEASISASEDTLTRWIRQDGIEVERQGRRGTLYVSYSDLLEAYTRRYPAPGRS